MKDPYSFSRTTTSGSNNEQANTPEDLGELSSFKGPKKATIRRILDYSKALEVLPQGRGSEAYELIRN